MKEKSSLLLMEILVMVLVFSLAAAVCLGIFARAEAITRETALLDEAMLLAENAAQRLKAGASPQPSPEGWLVTVQELPSQVPGLVTVRILVENRGEEIFSLTTGYQEGKP